MSTPFELRRPAHLSSPLIVSIPHCGVEVPSEVARGFASAAVANLPDTDWHLGRLYAFAEALGAATLSARYSRYVVDLNRPLDAAPLYPGRFETGLLPLQTFTGEAIYRRGRAPDEAERARRVEAYYRPYHDALQALLDEARAQFGYALLFEAHSIPSELPLLFEGRLPDAVVGDAQEQSAHPALSEALCAALRGGEEGSVALKVARNHPFKGGWNTRHYGRPSEGVHALQLELSQRGYMIEGPPFRYDSRRAEALIPILRRALQALLEVGARQLAPSGGP